MPWALVFSELDISGWLAGTLFSSAWAPIRLGMQEAHWAGNMGSKVTEASTYGWYFLGPRQPHDTTYSPTSLADQASEGQKLPAVSRGVMISRGPEP